MSVGNVFSKIAEEIREIFQENEKTPSTIVRDVLKEVVKKKIKKLNKSCMNMVSSPHDQDATAQVLVHNEATLSFVTKRFAQKLPIMYSLWKFMIILGNRHVCNTKEEVSLDLRILSCIKESIKSLLL